MMEVLLPAQGYIFKITSQYYTTNRFNDKNGHRIPLPRTDLDVVANVTQLIYVTNKKIFGANLGFSALLPWVVDDSVNDGLDNTVLKAETGLVPCDRTCATIFSHYAQRWKRPFICSAF